jgi:hypothetical protein
MSTLSGAGEVGQTFHITANASLLTGPTTETVSAGCSGTSGTGSNCIDIAFSINTTNGTFGTAAALATCGENNLNGNASFTSIPNGVCQTNGIGSLVRTFRIGPTQTMWNGTTGTGSPYDTGVDPDGGAFNQSAAFTCNIVAAKVVQCVKGANYALTAGPMFTVSLGQWATGSTFVEYGDSQNGTGFWGGMLGNVGGQPFQVAPGSSGYPSSATPYTITATGCTLASGGSGTGTAPKINVWVVGGAIVNVYGATATGAMGAGISSTVGCTWPLSSLGGGSGGTITAPPLLPVDGAYGIATYQTDNNMIGDLLYDNTGLVGNPLNSFFTNGMGGYFEPGLGVPAFGEFLGLAVSG